MTYKFNNSKYTRWYWQLIESRINRKLDNDKYYETHHIIPKSLGGTNCKSNLVKLTAREHFIAHLLLIRMVSVKDVYRMIHAVIRFKSKISSSREFELLRSTLHTYSKGKYNASFGKIWVHDKVTNDINYIHKDEFCANKMIKGLPYQRGGFKDYIWINNQTKESLIPFTDNIPSGWNKGRIFKASVEHMKRMSKNRHTPEKDKLHSEKMSGKNHFNYGKPGFTKGKRWINKNGKSKMINTGEIQSFLKEGWNMGRR